MSNLFSVRTVYIQFCQTSSQRPLLEWLPLARSYARSSCDFVPVDGASSPKQPSLLGAWSSDLIGFLDSREVFLDSQASCLYLV